MPSPSQITGGCLCASIRYTVSFSPAQWPPSTSNCQCTTCRKWTTTLVSHAIILDAAQLRFSARDTYAEYQSSENASRSFCSRCGSGIIWKSEEAMPGKVVLMTGTVDEEWIMGRRKGEGRETEGGTEVEWEGGFGEELCRPGMSLFWENVVKGVTNFDMGQKKFLQEA